MRRHRNDGLRKRCGCARRNWSECSHPWYLNFAWKGVHHRVNLDRVLGRTLKGKTEAKTEAENLRAAIRPAVSVAEGRRGCDDSADLQSDWRDFHRAVFEGTREAIVARGRVAAGAHCRARVRSLGTRGRASERSRCRASPPTTSRRSCSDCGRKAAPHRPTTITASTLSAVSMGHAQGLSVAEPARKCRDPATDTREASTAMQPGEEERLLAAAPPRLYRLIVAALETACGWESCSPCSGAISTQTGTSSAFVLRTPRTPRTGSFRLPLACGQCSKWPNHHPDGNALPLDAHVFGDAVGGRIHNITRMWHTCVLKAHGVTPAWEKRPHSGTDRRGIGAKLDASRPNAVRPWRELTFTSTISDGSRLPVHGGRRGPSQRPIISRTRGRADNEYLPQLDSGRSARRDAAF